MPMFGTARMVLMSDQDPTSPETQGNQPAEPQWIAVPPPHPGAAGGAAGSAPGSGLAISAMALGLLALLTVVISGLYFGYGAIAAGILGVAAIVLAVMAGTRQQRPKQARIVGIVGGTLSVVASIVLGTLMFTGHMTSGGLGSEAATNDTQQPQQGGDGNSQQGGTGSQDQGSEQESLLQWPANMETGGIHFVQGPNGPTAALSDPLKAGTAPLTPSVDRVNGPADILLYIDYRCPHCVDFEAANAKKLEELVSSGAATLDIRPMSFVSPFSVSVTNAMMCVVDSRPEDAWKAHLTLMGKNTQLIATPTALSAALDTALGGISSGLKSCIESDQFKPLASALSQWYLTSGVPNANDPNLELRGTPLAVVNGDAYTGNPADPAAFAAFLASHGL